MEARELKPRVDAKLAEIRRQLAINVDIAKRDHPEGPVIDGKRHQGLLHSQEVLAGHITDRLNELEAMLAPALSASRPDSELVKALEQARDFAAWVDTWVSNPVTAYSVMALDGLFSQARERLAALASVEPRGE